MIEVNKELRIAANEDLQKRIDLIAEEEYTSFKVIEQPRFYGPDKDEE